MIDCDQAGEFDDAAGAGGEVGDEVVGVAAEPEVADDVVGQRSLLSASSEPLGEEHRGGGQTRPVAGLGCDLHGLSYGQVGEERRRLERASESDAGSLVWGQAGHVAAEEVHVSRRREVAADGVQERGLACAVGADQADGLAGHRGDVHAVDGNSGAEGHLEVVGGEHAAVGVVGHRALGGGGRDHRSAGSGGGSVVVGLSRQRYQECISGVEADLDEPAREVHEQDEEADARCEERDEIVVGPQGRQADDPECAENRSGDRADAADHGDRDGGERGVDVEEFVEANRDEEPTERAAGESGDAAGQAEADQLRPGRRNGVRGGGFGVVTYGDDDSPDAGSSKSSDEEHDEGEQDEREPVVTALAREIEGADASSRERDARRVAVGEEVGPPQVLLCGEGEPEGDDRKHQTADPERAKSDDERHAHAHGRHDDRRRQERDLGEVDVERCVAHPDAEGCASDKRRAAECSDSGEGGLAERELACPAGEHDQREGEGRGEQHLGPEELA